MTAFIGAITFGISRLAVHTKTPHKKNATREAGFNKLSACVEQT